MTIRTFQAGDDIAQVSIYNEAAADLPKFKSATVDEIRRRTRGSDFDPTMRFYALAEGRPVGYSTFQANGRVSFPWCRKGHEGCAEPLLHTVLAEMRKRGHKRAFAAYRTDWPSHRDFFLAQGFTHTRDWLNFVMDVVEMPTPAARAGSMITALRPEDAPAVQELGKGILRTPGSAELVQALFHNPYFPPSSLFALRSRSDGQPVAVGIVVAKPEYANPNQVDATMPCFRLGAFGTEGLTHKRINGVFSVLAADTRDISAHALDLLGHAIHKVSETNVETFAAQVPSDARHLVRFYKNLFRSQGAFPIYEREL